MESPPRLGLGTINIAPFMEGVICYQRTHSWVGSTHCVLRLNLIKCIFIIYHSRLTHTPTYI